MLVLFTLIVVKSNAQLVSVNARMDTTHILIGDQVKLLLEVSQPAGAKVTFPNITDTLTDKVEVVSKSNVDSQKQANNSVYLTEKLTITSFDSGSYTIPPFRFAVKFNGRTDTFLTNTIMLNVNTFKIDSIKGITDIKPPMEAPFRLSEIMLYIYIVLAALILALAGYIIYKKFAKKEPIIRRRPKPKEPAHLIALRDLDLLTEKKLWQQNRVKEYYTELTDIIRTYIENRFMIMAMEQVTEEILERFDQTKLIDSFMYDKLQQMLVLADYVKFAKVIPLPDENDLLLKNAYDFVLKTKQEIVLTEPDKDDTIKTENTTEQ
ncbi:MAG: hypothetical protein NTW49_04365 [Bacteroidia bacterium]|nr:hypothetical protein [Bacteroidia bacterium]